MSALPGRLGRDLMRLLVKFHYPGIVVEGQKSLQDEGPFLFLANHPNSLIDPVVIGIATGRPVHYLAKAPLFETPILGLVMKALGMIPAFRGQDDRSQVKRNLESLDSAAAVLSDGRDLGIFPEGKSHDSPRLEPLRSGAARIAVLAHQKGATGLKIVPIGLNYEDKERFRSSVWVRIGKPIVVDEWLARSDGHAKRAIRELTGEVDARLRELIIGLNEPEWATIIKELEVLLPPSPRRRSRDPVAALRQRDRIANAINHFITESQPDAQEIGAAILRHGEQLREAGLSLDSPVLKHGGFSVWGGMIGSALRLCLGVVPVLVGTVHHILPYSMVRWLNERYSRSQPGRTTIAMMRILYGLPIYALWYFAVWWGMASYFMPWIATMWAIAAPFAGLYALNYWPAFLRTARHFSSGLGALLNPRKLESLRAKQDDLNHQLRALAAQYENVNDPLPEPPPFSWAALARRTIVRLLALGIIVAGFLWLNATIQRSREAPAILPGPDLARFSSDALKQSFALDEPALRSVISGLARLRGEINTIQREYLAGKRDFYNQEDNDAIRRLMLDYLNYRSVLLRLIWKYQNHRQIPDPVQRKLAGLVCLAAACTLYEASLGIVVQFDGEEQAIRKLNEAEPLWNVPEGMFDRIRRNLQNEEYQKRMLGALDEFAPENPTDHPDLRKRITASSAAIRNLLPQLKAIPFQSVVEDAVKTAKASAYDLQSTISMFIGRLRVRDPRAGGKSLIEESHLRQLEPRLRPGDLIIQRRNWALSNAFMPGYWSHVAIYIGTPDQLAELGLADDPRVKQHWEEFEAKDPAGHAHRLIEALGEGVIFTSLEHSVGEADGASVFRPRLTDVQRAECLARVFSHVGKPYDFQFDFFSTDKLVCTELVYRAFGEQVPLRLVDVMGRRTLPAMELLRQFMESPESAPKVEFVAFLDGDERVGHAAFRDLTTLKESLTRPSFQF